MVTDTVAQDNNKPIDRIEGWEVKKIKDVAPLKRGFDLPAKQISEGLHPVVYSNGILNRHDSFKAKAPGVVTGRSGTIGQVTFIEEDYWPHNTALWVTDFKGNYPKFIYYLYVHIRLERFGTGSGVPTLNRNDVHSHNVAIPKRVKEQSIIATVLSDMDELIASLDAVINKKHNIKQGVMQELLTGKRRMPGFRGEWKTKNLGDIFRITRGQVLSVKKMATTKTSDYCFPVYSSQTQKNGLVGYYNQCLFDNAITWTTDGANAGDVKYRKGKFYCTNVCGVLLNDSGFANRCVSEAFARVSRKYVSYVGNPKLMNNVVKDIDVLIPKHIKEQTAIAQVFSDMDAEIESLVQKREKYKMLKEGMMQQLLTGKIRLV